MKNNFLTWPSGNGRRPKGLLLPNPSFQLQLYAMLFFFATVTILSSTVFAATLPTGFAETQIVSNLDPTSMELAPDGRIFLTEKNGKVLVIKNGSLLSTPFVTINVDNYNERGLQSIAFDPNFATNKYVYVFYAVPSANRNRVSRFTANGDVAVSGSEMVIMELETLSGSVHNGGALFFKDGKLFITTGDGSNTNLPQSMNSLLGKVLRINTDGSIPTDNPFYTSASGAYRAIWALGFRNPFKASVDPVSGKIYITDVGSYRYEEVNEGLAGKNYGWPGIEGFRTNQTAPANYQNPVYAYDHNQGCAITGAAFYNPATQQFPSTYTGKFFFADYCNGYIKTLDPANPSSTTTFATGINRPVEIKVAADGSLYYIARGGMGGGSQTDNTSSNNGTIWRIQYTSSDAPSISSHPVDKTVPVGGSVTFSVTASGAAPLAYQWQRNGVNIQGATAANYTIASASLSDNGAQFRAIVSNSISSATSNAATLTVLDDQTPTATIVNPREGALYSGGTVINYSGTGTDPEDGNLPASAYTWWIDFHHDTHTHPAMAPVSGITSGSFTVPTSGETSSNVWYRIYLKVTDSKGLSHTTYRDVNPNKVTVTLATAPSGLQLKLDGQPVTTPYSFSGVVGIARSIEAVTPQVVNGVTYQFTAWSDGGAAQHTITTPSQNTTYTASFTQTQAVLRNPENPTNTVSGLNYSYYEGQWSNLPDFSTLTAVKSGTTAAFDISPRNRNDNFSFSYTGFVQVPADGEYTFFTSSDDGSKLYIGSTEVVNNDGLHGLQERSGKIGLRAGKHAIKVTFFENGGGEVLEVRYQGPGIAKQLIPASALSRTTSEVSSEFNGTYTLLARHSGKALDVSFASTADGANVQQWIPNGTVAQQWVIEPLADGYYKITSKASGKALEVSGNSTADGGNIQQWTYTGGANQQWKIEATTDGYYKVTARHSDKVVDVSAISTADGANVHQWIYVGGNNQQWKFNKLAAKLGQEALLSQEVELYPNPATDRVTIELEATQEKSVVITITNTVSQQVVKVSKNLAIGTNQVEVNTQKLKPGIYMVGVQIGNEQVTKKVVITR